MIRREIAAGKGGRWRAALADWDARLDDEAARRAARAFEELADGDACGADALAWCARARYYLGDYAADPAARRQHFEQGARLGRLGVRRQRDHVPALFWTAACAGSVADGANALRRAVLVPEILELLRAVWERDRDYYHGGPARFAGQALVRQPGVVRRLLGAALPGLGPAELERALARSIETDPPFVLTHQTRAQLAWCTRRDRALVEESIRAIEALDLDADPALAPENRRDQPRALDLLRALAR